MVRSLRLYIVQRGVFRRRYFLITRYVIYELIKNKIPVIFEETSYLYYYVLFVLFFFIDLNNVVQNRKDWLLYT